jgi:hypothetical protein
MWLLWSKKSSHPCKPLPSFLRRATLRRSIKIS